MGEVRMGFNPRDAAAQPDDAATRIEAKVLAAAWRSMPRFPSEVIDLKKWLTGAEVRKATARQGKYVKVLSRKGWG